MGTKYFFLGVARHFQCYVFIYIMSMKLISTVSTVMYFFFYLCELAVFLLGLSAAEMWRSRERGCVTIYHFSKYRNVICCLVVGFNPKREEEWGGKWRARQPLRQTLLCCQTQISLECIQFLSSSFSSSPSLWFLFSLPLSSSDLLHFQVIGCVRKQRQVHRHIKDCLL